MKKILLTSIVILSSLVSGCMTKSTSSLNMHHIKAMGIVDETESSAIFCGGERFHQMYSETPIKPKIYIALNNGNKYLDLDFQNNHLAEYDRKKHIVHRHYQENNIIEMDGVKKHDRLQHVQTANSLNSLNTEWQKNLSSDCGAGKAYPYIYLFTFQIAKELPQDTDKRKAYLKKYEVFKNQIINNRSLTIRATRHPWMIGVSYRAEKPSTIIFNDEQYNQLKEILEAE